MRLALVLLTLVVAACSTAPLPSPSPSRVPVSWSGKTDIETDRSPLSGDYVATWSLTMPSGTPLCVFGAYLWGTGSNVVSVVGIAEQSGGTRVHGLLADRYYLKVTTSCPWAVTLTPE